VAANRRRCTERVLLEFHHLDPHALGGEATIANISLRCRSHNVYEAELVFGPGVPVPAAPLSAVRVVREAGAGRVNSPRGELGSGSSPLL
jgi:hypothetical protein